LAISFDSRDVDRRSYLTHGCGGPILSGPGI